MTITIKDVELGFDADSEEGLLILPENYYDKNDHRFHESSISFYKYAKDKINIDFIENPKVLLEQRSGEWFGPVILITSAALSQSPQLLSIATGVIANYLTDFFKGKSSPDVEVKIIYKDTPKSKFTEIHYKGDSNGLAQVNEAISKLSSGQKNDE